LLKGEATVTNTVTNPGQAAQRGGDRATAAHGVSRRRLLQTATASIGGMVLLAGCSALTGSTTAQPTTAPAAVTGVVQPLLRGGAQEVDAWKKAFALFEAKYPRITVDATYTTDDYDDKTVALVAAGTPPGLWFPAANTGVKHWAAKGLIENLDPYIQRDKFDLKVFYETYLPYMKFNGHTVALPLDEWPFNVYYNVNLLQKAGLTPPTDWNDKTWTWDKYLELGRRLTQATGGQTSQWGIGDSVLGGYRFSAMLYGGDWFPEDSYLTGWIKEFTGTASEVVQAYQFLSDLRYKHHVSPTADEQSAGGGINALFMAGKIAMTISAAGFLETLRRQAQGLEWGIAAVPLPPAKPRRTLIWVDHWTFFHGVPNPDAAWQLLKFMETPDAQVIYPLQSGPVPSLKSLAGDWIKLRQDSNNQKADVLRVALNAVPVSHVSADNYTVNWPDLDQVLKQPMSDVLAGKTDAQAAIQSLAAAAKEAIRQSSAGASG
jgi:multiple sugar transport system substrate-binding protein